jgi:hypothetical protein
MVRGIDNPPDGMARVRIRVDYRGTAHEVELAASDTLSAAFIHSLLTEAVDRVRESLRTSPDEHARIDREARAERNRELLKAASDHALEAGLGLPLVSTGVACRAIVVRQTSAGEVRASCGATLDPDGSCPEDDLHLNPNLQAPPGSSIQAGKWYREHTPVQLRAELVRRGIPVPGGAARDDVDKLSALLNRDDRRNRQAQDDEPVWDPFD